MRIARTTTITMLRLMLAALLLMAIPAAAQDARPQPAGRASGAGQQAAGAAAPDAADALSDQWYSTQLHIHSWSNHNGAVRPASVEMNTAWAANAGIDVIWWADHNPSYNQGADFPISFNGAAIGPNTLDVTLPLPPNTPWWAVYNYVTLLKASVSGGGQATASLNNALLRMQLLADADQTFDRFEYRALTTDGIRLQGLSFTRPLLSDPLLSFDAARCDNTGADAYAQVRVGLSWHNNSQPQPQELVYRLVAAGQPGGVVSSSTRVTVTVPLDGSRVELPLLEHASLLPDGDDNAIQELYIAVGARNGAQACLELGDFVIHSRSPSAQELLQAHKTVTARNQAAYGVTQHHTWEQFSGERHLNPYLPTSSTLLPGLNDIQVGNFVPLVHSQGGLVMLNHPFGAGYGNALPPDQQEALVQSLLSLMLPVQGWNLDLIEIYKRRGRVDLYHHLRLWDLLGANGIQLCAAATSDAHGAPFTLNHAMVVWINAPSPSQDDLLAGLRGCRLFFGDLRLFDGVLDLRLGSTPMGGVYPLRPGMQPLHVVVDPLPAGAQVQLVQQRLQPGNELVHLIDHQVIDPTQPVLIDVSQPSQVRVEMWAADGSLMAVSNRIVIKPLACDIDNSGQVDIADVQSIANAFGQSVPPAPARYDLRPDRIIDLWDVMTAGECWLVR